MHIKRMMIGEIEKIDILQSKIMVISIGGKYSFSKELEISVSQMIEMGYQHTHFQNYNFNKISL